MTPEGKYARGLINRMRASQTAGPVLLAVTIGAGAGVTAVAFLGLIDCVHKFCFNFLGGLLRSGFGRAYTVLILALGGFVVGLISLIPGSQSKGHGVPEVMLAVAYYGGRIRPRAMWLKVVASAVTLGSGGSAGCVGPLVRIGAAVGSGIAQVCRLPDRRMVLSVACGSAAGIAAAFNAPIAGVMFALEVILGKFTSLSFGLLVVSSVSATMVSRALLGDFPAFHIPQEYSLTSIWELPLFIVLGIGCALLARAFTLVLYLVDDLAEKVKIPSYVKPAIGGAVVGVIGIWWPEVFSTGYRVIDLMFRQRLVIPMLLLLCALKLVCTSITLGSGGSGGIFAPSLFIGAMFGAAFGKTACILFPGIASAWGAYAVVGMAATFAAAAHAPITAIIIIFEMTDDYRLILPLMAATVLGTLVVQRLSPDSIYTLKLRRRGIHLGAAQDVNLMDAITVEEAMSKEFRSVSPQLPLTELMTMFAAEHETSYPVIDADGALVGIVTMQDLELALSERSPEALSVRSIATKNVLVCRPEQTISSALAQFGARNFACLPVVDPQRPECVIGVLKRSDVIAAYADAHAHNAELIRKVDHMRDLSERQGTELTESALTAGSDLAGVCVRDAGFPPEAILITVRRADHTIIPAGATRLEPGDVLVTLCKRQDAKTVWKWLKGHC